MTEYRDKRISYENLYSLEGTQLTVSSRGWLAAHLTRTFDTRTLDPAYATQRSADPWLKNTLAVVGLLGIGGVILFVTLGSNKVVDYPRWCFPVAVAVPLLVGVSGSFLPRSQEYAIFYTRAGAVAFWVRRTRGASSQCEALIAGIVDGARSGESTSVATSEPHAGA